MTEDDIRDAFNFAFTGTYNDSTNFSSWYTQSFNSFNSQEQQLVDAIENEAKEYYGNLFKKNFNDKQIRKSLTEQEKVRVVEFMKSRLEYYNNNGFLIS